MGIRRAAVNDIDAIFAIARESHLSQPYRGIIPSDKWEEYRRAYEANEENRKKHAKKIRRYITENNRWAYVYETVDRQVVGYSLAHKKDGTLYLKSLFVHPAYQGKGIGAELFRELLRELKPGMQAKLIVLKDNVTARQLYGKNGFIETDEIPNQFYGAEQVIMTKRLD